MNLFLDSFWRAMAYCLLPRVIALSFLPLLLLVALTAAVAWWAWEPAVRGMQAWLSDWALLESLFRWLESVAMGHLRAVVVPLLVLLLALPLVVVLALLAVAWLVTPTVVQMVVQRRFPDLQARHGGSFWGSMGQGLASGALALLALMLTMPLWLIPPLVIVLPPLIWGWMTSRVMVYDTLASHASAEERAVLMRRHRGWLLAIGVLTGLLSGAPAMLWAIGAMAIVFAPLLLPVAIWIYTFVFIFAALWFSHYTLAALAALRVQPLEDLAGDAAAPVAN